MTWIQEANVKFQTSNTPTASILAFQMDAATASTIEPFRSRTLADSPWIDVFSKTEGFGLTHSPKRRRGAEDTSLQTSNPNLMPGRSLKHKVASASLAVKHDSVQMHPLSQTQPSLHYQQQFLAHPDFPLSKNVHSFAWDLKPRFVPSDPCVRSKHKPDKSRTVKSKKQHFTPNSCARASEVGPLAYGNLASKQCGRSSLIYLIFSTVSSSTLTSNEYASRYLIAFIIAVSSTPQIPRTHALQKFKDF